MKQVIPFNATGEQTKTGAASLTAEETILEKPINPRSVVIQRKLSIGAVNDPLEAEADAMADNVMRMPAVPFIQRKCAECEEEEKAQRKPLASFIQKKEAESSRVAGDAATNGIESSRGNGNGMDAATRSFMESRFGTDFSDVRIHDNGQAAQLSNQLQAKAFTVGDDIFFNQGRYAPGSAEGKRLLAHELTHTLQQKENSPLHPMMIQRDLAVEPTAPEAVGRGLTSTQMRSAIRWNGAAFPDADEISLLRDVLGISAGPAVIDEDFIRALVQYQANYGLTQDGLLGAGTARRLADELQAEATFMGADADVGSATEMALNPAQRRTRLRSRVVSRLGQMLHQGFVGSSDNPTGIVTVRSGFTDPTISTPPTARDTNTIGINYTGANADNSRWLQFTFSQMSAIDPATTRRSYQSGSVTTSGGTYNYSDGTTFHWNVDATPASGSMYYEAGGTDVRVAGSYTEIMDQPAGWNTAAETFAASFATRPASVRLIKGFDTYLIVDNNKTVYHVRWNLYFTFNTATSPAPDVTGVYEVLTAGAIGRLPSALKTVLNTRFPGNTVP